MSVARLGNIELPYNPNGVDWDVSVNTHVVDTLGGRVIQVLSVSLSSLTLEGDAGSRAELMRLMRRVRELAQQQVRDKRASTLTIPVVGSFSRGAVIPRVIPEVSVEHKLPANLASFGPVAIRNAILATGHDPGGRVDVADVEVALTLIGHDYGGQVDPADIQVLLRQTVNVSGTVGIPASQDSVYEFIRDGVQLQVFIKSMPVQFDVSSTVHPYTITFEVSDDNSAISEVTEDVFDGLVSDIGFSAEYPYWTWLNKEKPA